MTSYIVDSPHARIHSVYIIKKYLELRNGLPEEFLFSNFKIVSKKPRKVEFLNKVFTYGNCLKLLRVLLDRVGLVGDSFTLHGVKSGAFSEAYNSGRVDVNLLHKHARWVSRSMTDRYHQRSLDACLAPTRALDLNNV